MTLMSHAMFLKRGGRGGGGVKIDIEVQPGLLIAYSIFVTH